MGTTSKSRWSRIIRQLVKIRRERSMEMLGTFLYPIKILDTEESNRKKYFIDPKFNQIGTDIKPINIHKDTTFRNRDSKCTRIHRKIFLH